MCALVQVLAHAPKPGRGVKLFFVRRFVHILVRVLVGQGLSDPTWLGIYCSDAIVRCLPSLAQSYVATGLDSAVLTCPSVAASSLAWHGLAWPGVIWPGPV